MSWTSLIWSWLLLGCHPAAAVGKVTTRIPPLGWQSSEGRRGRGSFSQIIKRSHSGSPFNALETMKRRTLVGTYQYARTRRESILVEVVIEVDVHYTETETISRNKIIIKDLLSKRDLQVRIEFERANANPPLSRPSQTLKGRRTNAKFNSEEWNKIILFRMFPATFHALNKGVVAMQHTQTA
ncbi:hypothetical protein CEXT_427681 [Caerostris extrusa]|uniref:Secreted protein n=1 Tax=Caerostris extrusa TaxID=172846 RepID=A0AAV4YG30_CAEEX|nr:hypothetical protein CEXT_427681 [Caerostris extrusa]